MEDAAEFFDYQIMKPENSLPTAHDKLLFTPGTLTTSLSVKQAMLHDAGSWHYEFNAVVHQVRKQLLAVAGLSREAGYEAILLQGSGTFGMEAVFATCVPPQGKVAVMAFMVLGTAVATLSALLPGWSVLAGFEKLLRAAVGG